MLKRPGFALDPILIVFLMRCALGRPGRIGMREIQRRIAFRWHTGQQH
jgi:hypothetical protein